MYQLNNSELFLISGGGEVSRPSSTNVVVCDFGKPLKPLPSYTDRAGKIWYQQPDGTWR